MKTTDSDTVIGCLIGLLTLPLIFFRGYLMKVMWAWFIVPFGVQEIGIAHAMGLSILISIFHPRPMSTPQTAEQQVSAWFVTLITLLLEWGVAAIVHGCM